MPSKDNRDDLRAVLDLLKPKTKGPANKRVLDSWINQIENSLTNERSGRLAWLVASTVVTVALQRAVDGDGRSRFLLKGGTMLQHRLGGIARATRDLDGMVRGDIEGYLEVLDDVFKEQWGPLQLHRGEVEVIETPAKIIKPRAFMVSIMLKGDTWRKIKVEISPGEGGAGDEYEEIKPPSFAGLGLPTPDSLTALAMRYQIAQKVHSATDPHNPPEYVNNRPRDVVDLILIRDLVKAVDSPANAEIREAIVDVFAVRAVEAQKLNRLTRTWPARLSVLSNWEIDYRAAAEKVGITLSVEEAVAEVNTWLDEIDGLSKVGGQSSRPL
ncbi:MAG: nucleotidyl transferase AbiEii/AbiGii toxin family protein [Coriobacteriales bacterium]|jgi:hypothetical protein|nr:nucleotidyl transferase AbiEii/AbiGii toxin family protein [Coriobacteriales bacterium]